MLAVFHLFTPIFLAKTFLHSSKKQFIVPPLSFSTKLFSLKKACYKRDAILKRRALQGERSE